MADKAENKNLAIYEAYAEPPETALKTIQAGKLKGFTDVNPMWRIKALTELFGPCGFGWYTKTTRQWLEEGKDGRVAAFVNIELYVYDAKAGKWSMPIEGTGGSMLVNIFKGNPETSDEAFKMAYTDALSVACKSLGFAAHIYWQQGRTKYSAASPEYITESQLNTLKSLVELMNTTRAQLGQGAYELMDVLKGQYKDKAPKSEAEITGEQYGPILAVIKKEIDRKKAMLAAKEATEEPKELGGEQ